MMKYETQMVWERSDLKVLINAGTHRVSIPWASDGWWVVIEFAHLSAYSKSCGIY